MKRVGNIKFERKTLFAYFRRTLSTHYQVEVVEMVEKFINVKEMNPWRGR